MISRIRVEARAASMSEAEREIEIFLAHARQAAFLEGICPQSSIMTDHHFGSADVRNGYENRGDVWSQLGLTFDGRIVVSFEPELIEGGLKLFSHKVSLDYSDQISDPRMMPADHLADITEQSIVLTRFNAVSREHTWEHSSAFPPGPDALEQLVRDVEHQPGVGPVSISHVDGGFRAIIEHETLGSLMGEDDTVLGAVDALSKIVFALAKTASANGEHPTQVGSVLPVPAGTPSAA